MSKKLENKTKENCMTKEIKHNNLYAKISELLQTARQTAVRAVNQVMVYTYYEIGKMIIEDEQHGKERAEYGKKVLLELSKRLTTDYGKGFSVENLDRMRFFYQVYSKAISSKVLTKSDSDSIPATPLTKFVLSWSHYLKLMRMENPEERNFYEIECASNNWSLKELQRQYDSGLYQRLALSRDKDGVKQLAEKGQIIEKPSDLIKEPYILEFLGLSSHSSYSESELESAIIDKIEHFLKELGKGFMFVNRQERISFDERHFYIDLVFYNRIFASRYQTVLPDKKAFIQLLEQNQNN